MRFAPPNPLRIADRASGLNALSVRSHNERLVLSLLLQNEGTSRMEIGEKTGLSAQTISVIVRSLEQEGLIARGEAQRGRVGPPAIPLSLNPEGAYSVGISIGFRFIDVVLIDFVGKVRQSASISIPAGLNSDVNALVVQLARSALDKLPANLHGRIAGIGLALPEDLDKLPITTDGQTLDAVALQRQLEKEFELPVFVQNDITAAAGAESMFGVAKSLNDYLFFYLGGRVRSRLILNHQIFHGNSHISFDVGVFRLESELRQKGVSVSPLWARGSSWPDFGAPFEVWVRECVARLGQSVAALAQFVDIKTVVISSDVPPEVSGRMCAELTAEMSGITALAGKAEYSPKAVGAASLPFSSRFMVS